ncbi:hypothetical protein AVEN_244440-1 [Araneus ventricosus]|uniref:Uncharacterized protein n=1 Tax=Araneus ventricosus TaxID=182803 RepID=A0A4Y2NZU8_ARAVE|nr:hypothetical protein AVEN_244440-1 [Araneus ventricosus]
MNSAHTQITDAATLRMRGSCLVILTSRFEATVGKFFRTLWDAPLNLESRSDDEDDSWAGTLPPDFRTAPKGGRMIHVRFNTQIYGGSSVESGFKPEVAP